MSRKNPPKEPVYGPKSSIKDIEVVNDRLYGEVARLTKLSKGEVRDMIEFVGTFVGETIKRGEMETVMIPYFGKFKPREKVLEKYKDWKQFKQNPELVDTFRALMGKEIKPGKDETI